MPWKTSNGRLDRLLVYSRAGSGESPVGALTFEGAGRRRISTFRYARTWLDSRREALDPRHLPVIRRAFASPPGQEVPLPFLDAAPDGWGRLLLERTFPEQHFGAAEFLAAAGDERMGELAFGPDVTGSCRWIPPCAARLESHGDLDSLEDLEVAAAAVDQGRDTPDQLSMLFRASADVGGARPKATIRHDGVCWIAKFRAHGDALDDPRVEAATLTIARACGIEVPDHEVRTLSGGRAALLVRRFDRRGHHRLAYSSAATLLGTTDLYSTCFSYADLAAHARQVGVAPCEEDLFRRMLFNCFVRNTDDHLRNHGFVRGENGWRLSPAFDLTVNRHPRLVMLPAKGIDPTANPTTAFAAYPAFALSRPAAKRIYEEIVDGLGHVAASWDLHGLSLADRGRLSEAWNSVLAPAATIDLPPSPLTRKSHDVGGDPVLRLSELAIDVDVATHSVVAKGQSIEVRRRVDGALDNASGMPARIGSAWSDSPRFEYFEGGERVAELTSDENNGPRVGV